MFDVSFAIIRIQQQIIDMQKINGLNWLKLSLQLIPPIIGLISPFIAFRLGFKNALALEKIKEINEKNKIK